MVKLKATTIIETVIAMVIILIVFLVAGTIFLNISKAGVTEKKIMASEMINTYMNQFSVNSIPDERTEAINGYLISTEVSAYEENDSVALVYCRIYDGGKLLISEQKRLLRINK